MSIEGLGKFFHSVVTEQSISTNSTELPLRADNFGTIVFCMMVVFVIMFFFSKGSGKRND